MSSMILRGDLKDIFLPSLVELICLKRRTTWIVFERPGQTATLYFQDGELVDATAGSSRGEAAVFELLGWDGGTFELVDVPAPPERSVKRAWNQLVLEGAQKVDESRHEEEVEDAVVTLVSILEQLKLRLQVKKLHKKPREALRLYAELVNRTLELGGASPQLALEERPLQIVVAQVAAGNPGAAHLEPVEERLAVDRIEASFRANGRRTGWTAVYAAVLDVLECYLDLVVGRFTNPELRQLWSETCGGLMRELRETLDLSPR